MDMSNHNTEKRTNKHLSYEERFFIQLRLAEQATVSSIAKALNRSRITIYAEIKRGTTAQIKNGKTIFVYFTDKGQLVYEQTRTGSSKHFKASNVPEFLEWVLERIQKDKWSLDASVGYARSTALFSPKDMLCTKTLYNYLHLGLLQPLTLTDMPLITRRLNKTHRNRAHKKKLGKSIDERPEVVESRSEFGHWEVDTVRGIKDKNDKVLVTIVERKTRFYVVLQSPSAKARDVVEVLKKWLSNFSPEYRKLIFKTLTADNGMEFANLHELEEISPTVYFAHPYSSWDGVQTSVIMAY